MNPFIAALITLALMTATTVRADNVNCNLTCQQEKQHCANTLGADSQANCEAGFRVCVQRCNPQKMSRDFLDSSQQLGAYLSQPQEIGSQQCTQGCTLRARNCIDAGTQRGECLRLQQICADRCKSN